MFTPYAGLILDINRQVSAYASYTSNFRPQTIEDRTGAYLDPLEGDSYEAGLKGNFSLAGSLPRPPYSEWSNTISR